MPDENDKTRRAMFFDTHIFRLLIEDEKFLKNFSEKFSERYGRQSFYVESTPFMLLEYLGVKIPKFDEGDIVDLDKIKSIKDKFKHLKKLKDKSQYSNELKKLKEYIFKSPEEKYLKGKRLAN